MQKVGKKWYEYVSQFLKYCADLKCILKCIPIIIYLKKGKDLISFDLSDIMNRKKDIEIENKKLRYLRLMIDLTTQVLYQTHDLTLTEGLRYIDNARKFAEELFPSKGKTFDLIYRPRLMRVLQERGILEFSHN